MDDERPIERQDARPASPEAHDRSTPVREGPAWLTYAQAGERLGMSPEAVRHRARRAGWRMMPGNEGRTLVLVPDDIEPVRTADRTPARTTDHPDESDATGPAERAFDTALSAITAAHVAEVTALRERADAADHAREAAEARAERAETRAEALRDRLVAAEVAQREAQDAARAAREGQQAAQAEAEQLRQAEAERQGRGRVARAWAAWRGR